MIYEQIKDLCRHGKIGLIPNWKGYLKWDYAKNELYFQNNDYILTQSQLEDDYKISSREDLFYII